MVLQKNMGKNTNPHYFEGILQLRNPSKELINYVKSKIKKDERCNIAKEKKVKNGIDLYLSSNKYMKQLGRSLQESFGGQLIFSSKLHTKDRQTSKEVHRGYICFRLPDFKKGDIISYKGNEIKIIGLQKKVYAQDIKTKKKLHIDYKELIR